ncbi:hypothetical protein B0T16DRAFT_450576 [Cercophora newfieldiana]|uniref:Zn(2)-C6 fungal-type domain-containing protein n=1 Tax=Cercophora newfieldiana TaxID=92897 RepID=A0AA40CZD2_9PEZI|nr:hypothetical protein B0T16DRAFT_450576 [Cercophora newfieldiana]
MDPIRRRRRPALSCSLCRQRKIRCDRETPCGNCVKSDKAVCDYGSNNPPPSLPIVTQREHEQNSAQADRETRRPTPTPTTSSSRSGIDTPLSTQSGASPAYSSSSTIFGPAPATSANAATSAKATLAGLSDAFYVHYEQEQETASETPSQHIPRCVTHKTRLFGQSHWVSPSIILFRDLLETLEGGNIASAFANIQRCKSLSKLIKARRAPPWPTMPTRDLPSKDLADVLVDHYLQTMETIYRTLHIPTFKKAYDALWLPGAEPELPFVVQVKLVCAIGATAYDDHFSLRTTAIRWIHEAMTWNSCPKDYKPRLTVLGLQNHILLLVAQSIVGVGRDMVYAETGALVRTAMHMGLHRDPSRLQPPIPLRAAEMRRRLWNTIIELVLHSALDSGGPVLLSVDDFDTAPPANYNDIDLDLECPPPGPPPPLTTPTQSAVPVAFRQSFPQRLAIAKFLNGLPPSTPNGPYAAALALDGALQTAYRALSSTLRSHLPCLSILYIDVLFRRYFLALHVPFLEASLAPASVHSSKFLYSRNTALDSALRVWSITSVPPSSSTTHAQTHPRNEKQNQQNENSLLTTRILNNTSSRFLRAGTIQAIFVVAAELRSQILASRDSLVPISSMYPSFVIRQDLWDVIRQAENWSLDCIKAGETNVKGFLFVCLIRTWLEGMLLVPRGSDGDGETVRRLVVAAEEAARTCLGILEGMVGDAASGGGGGDGGVMEGGDGDVGGFVGGMEGLDFENVTMSDFLFGFEESETVSWA